MCEKTYEVLRIYLRIHIYAAGRALREMGSDVFVYHNASLMSPVPLSSSIDWSLGISAAARLSPRSFHSAVEQYIYYL